MEWLIGIGISLLVEGIKKYWEPDSFMIHIILFVSSMLAALAYILLSSNDALWQSFLQIVLVASTTHNLILRKLEDNPQIIQSKTMKY